MMELGFPSVFIAGESRLSGDEYTVELTILIKKTLTAAKYSRESNLPVMNREWSRDSLH